MMRMKTNKAAERLARKAREFPKAMQRQLRVAMPKAGQTWQTQARILAPERDGNLKDAIDYEVTHGGLQLVMFVDAERLPVPGNARWQEFGTAKMPANPYFFAAWRTKKRAVRVRIRRALKLGAQKAAE